MEVFKQKVFFFTCHSQGTPEAVNFHHLLIDLAGGFRDIGIQYYSSNSYWKLSPTQDEFLFQFSPGVNYRDCDIVVLDRLWFEVYGKLPDGLFAPSRNYITVYMDCSDGFRTSSWLPEFKQFDFIFKTHHSKKVSYPDNIYPWAFGLSDRVLRECHNFVPIDNRERSLLVNFRHHHKSSHSLRKFVERAFIPKIQGIFSVDSSMDDLSLPPNNPYHYLRWAQTGRRHYPSYYQRLKSSTACACFGGFFRPPKFSEYSPKLEYYLSRLISELGLKSDRIAQWDSWRFWESLAAGCVTFHVDFEKYGFELPVMPKNWEHYIGLDLDDIPTAVDKIQSQPTLLEKIACEGRSWAIANYSPQASALRFLNTVSKVKNNNSTQKV